MRAGVLFSGTGPILILTSYDSFTNPGFIEKLTAKGIKKFIAHEVDVEKVKERYGKHYDLIMHDLRQTDDLRVMDYDGHHVFYNFSLKEYGEEIAETTVNHQ